MDTNSSAHDEVRSPAVLRTAPLLVAVACTAAAAALRQVARRNLAARAGSIALTESLWGIVTAPLSGGQRLALLAACAVALAALVAHAAVCLGPGGAVFVAGVVGIVLRNVGILRRLRLVLQGRGADVRARAAKGDGALPVWVVTGFLGSGKTTLVNRIVRAAGIDGAAVGARLLVIENEAGDTALDAELLLQTSGVHAENVVLVNDGCACCRLRGDLCDLLRDEVLGRRRDCAGVVIECSGLADPRAVAQTFLLDEDLSKRLQLREVVAVVDAQNAWPHLQSLAQPGTARTPFTRLVEEQLAFASIVLLNKIDHAARRSGDLVGAIRVVNPTAELASCNFCDVDPALVLGGSGASWPPVGAWSPDRALVEIERMHLRIGGPEPSAAGPSSSEHDGERVCCVSIRIDGNLDLDAFSRWVLRTLSDFDVMRAKGVLAVEGRREKLAFQAVHAAFDGTPSLRALWRPGEPRHSEIVVIGCGITPELLRVGLDRCTADSVARGNSARRHASVEIAIGMPIS